mmetsp:Transcript_57555/g.106332  ORF Transcript_57555/g.106332 Transcript_57555/m.106332 type:complete len:346 (-) Transcript_57555:29-1066(-)
MDSGIPVRRLTVACQTRLPAACQSMVDEHQVLGFLIYKNHVPHKRQRYLTGLRPTLNRTRTLLDRCTSASFTDLVASAINGGMLQSTVSALGEKLTEIIEEALGLRQSAQKGCNWMCPLAKQGFFVPLSFTAIASLGRLYVLAGEIMEAATVAHSALGLPLAQADQRESSARELLPTVAAAGAIVEEAGDRVSELLVDKPASASNMAFQDEDDDGVAVDAMEVELTETHGTEPAPEVTVPHPTPSQVPSSTPSALGPQPGLQQTVTNIPSVSLTKATPPLVPTISRLAPVGTSRVKPSVAKRSILKRSARVQAIYGRAWMSCKPLRRLRAAHRTWRRIVKRRARD